MGLEIKSDLDQPYRLFTAVGFGVEKPAVDALLSHARDAAYTAHSVATVQLAPDGKQVNVDSGDGKTQTLAYGDAKKSVSVSEMGISYDVYENGNRDNVSHVKLSMGNKLNPFAPSSDKQNFDITADGKTITGTCDTKDKITTCTQEVKDAAGNLLIKGMSTSDIYKSPNKFSRTTTYTDAYGKPLGAVSSNVAYDADKGTIKIDSTTTK